MACASREAGKPALANRVRWIAAEDTTAGYDILSFEANGEERHIEVKATKSAKSDFDQFWLTQNEVLVAERDNNWTLCRVWNVDGLPDHEFLGNIIQKEPADWIREAESWRVRKQPPTAVELND